MDINVHVKFGLIEYVKIGFGLYIGKELGKHFCEKAVPVLKEKIKTIF